MAHDDQFTALGPPSSGSGFPFSAFSTSATGMEYGVNAQGGRCGVYGESVNFESGRESDVQGVGVHGFGENFGVFGNGNRGIAGVFGQHNRRRGVGIIGASMRGGTGVVGVSLASLGNPLVTFASTPNPADGSGTGVFGSSGSGAGVLGTSHTGRGGVFQSIGDEGEPVVAQMRLVPRTMIVPNVVSASPVMVDPTSVTELPLAGQSGDLLVTQNEEGSCTLWFCVRAGEKDIPAQWSQVLLGETIQGSR